MYVPTYVGPDTNAMPRCAAAMRLLKGKLMKTLETVLRNDSGHWVGDGFPVRSLFSYHGDTRAISPFLLFDYAGPWNFEPTSGHPRGVG